MLSALINGIIGSLAVLYVGTHWAGLTLGESALAILAANISGFVCLIVTLQLERVRWIKKHILVNGLVTWGWHTTIWISGIALLSPPLRASRPMVTMLLPMILSCGLCIIPFGPTQDFLVGLAQRREKRRRSSGFVLQEE